MLEKENQKYNLISYKSCENGITLKELLLDKLNMSLRFISKVKKDKSIFVNGEFKRLSYEVKKGDLIEIKINEDPNNFECEDLNIDILYDDFDIILVNKPPFMVVHPTKSHPKGTLANGLMFYLKDENEKSRIRFVNRLDMNTSGLLVVAKNAYAHHILSEDMNKNLVTKKYLTVVKGVVQEDFGTINAPIYRPSDDSVKRIVHENGQKSITHFKVIERLKDATVLEILLETGRTHQIRVHLSYMGYPIIGDELYGYVDENLIKRQALHALSLDFKQPRTRENLHFKADVPNDIKELIDKLRED
ncbi:RluA family pseudouridine synthase [Tepidibacter thalassicus]|uniref:Pseudouridine synthase n=1 Tax=Tepidibacter thalassicus DSM 15285 TaxID=1123350 RepID=A0A1M5PG48_9FIRM|nr:RluA family pseudouridine synthase [Tepidibacter thalassicus]SHH00718.1 23S rRNA pseudouridine1911/1915/1917 synthase [Tepidibacter thalassicus DSM 15285]